MTDMSQTASHQGGSLQLQAYLQIREKIVYAEYAPGSRLQVKDLCEDLGMGRTPIREALVRLCQEGLAHAVPQSGTYVSLISTDAIESARFAREHIERQIAVGCCGRATDEDIMRLVEVIRQQKRALDEGDRRSFFDGDNLLHKVMYEIAGRQRVWEWMGSIDFDLRRYRWLRMQTEALDWNDIMNQHYAICDAIAARNPDEADYRTSAHLHLLFLENSAVLKAFPGYFERDLRATSGARRGLFS